MKTAAKLVIALALLAAAALAEDAFYRVPLTVLNLTDGQLPQGTYRARDRDSLRASIPYAVLDGEGEVFVNCLIFPRWEPASAFYENASLAVRIPEARDITGRLYMPKTDGPGMVRLAFKVPAGAADPKARESFCLSKERHYERLRRRRIPGGAWFRHQAREAREARTAEKGEEEARPVMPTPPRTGELEETYAILTGGRAMSENLQLDRPLVVRAEDEAEVDIASLQGITVQEMDWAALTKGLSPERDPLAAIVPADQHALFFATFQAMLDTMDEASAHGTPVLRLVDPRSEDARTRERYERQLCMKADALSRLVGPTVIAGVAFTGSDPYMRTGTDVAVLYDARNLALLKNLLMARQAAALKTNPDARAVGGEVGGVEYVGVRSPDRTICSYLATVGNAIVVTNSLDQLRSIVATAAGEKQSIASLPEYTFLRSRYPRGDKEETAFLIVTDAAIRRWCGPRWRIAASRRTRAAALLAELQAGHLDELARGTVAERRLSVNLPGLDLGEVSLTARGVTSSVYGTLEFLTPIAEMPLAAVTGAEAQAYNRWRRGYERNWRQYFDPIAVRFSLGPERIAADVTVMPLIEGSDYRETIELVRGAKIAPDAGDQHEGALLHFAMAINKKSEPVRELAGFMEIMATDLGIGPFEWLGQSIALYLDDDPLWDELGKDEDLERFLEREYHRLPIALRVEVSGALELAAFLATVRAFIEQTSPGMTLWESLKYKDQPYVRIAPSAEARADEGAPEELAVYYAVTPQSLLLTLNEDLLKRALDRQAARRQSAAEGEEEAQRAKPWLGESMCLQADGKVLDLIEVLTREPYSRTMQLRAWGNIPILNEWKRLLPDKDAVALHQKLWQTRLVCPGGGSYGWNEEWQTMESTVYGHPGEPEEGPPAPPQLAGIVSGNFGVTFEHGGLRARAVLDREAPNE